MSKKVLKQFYAENFCLPEAPVPQRLRPRRNLSATDFNCDQCNFSITGMVADQSPISHCWIAARSAIVEHLVRDLSVTDRWSVGD